jgi:WD40 repeat protein
LVSGGDDGVLRVWDASNGQPLRTISLGKDGNALAVAWSPDGTTIAAGGSEGILSLWDAKSGKQVGRVEANSVSANGIAWNPLGKQVATAGPVGFQLLDLASNTLAGISPGSPSSGYGVSWSRHWGLLASGGGGKRTILVCDISGGQPSIVLQAYTSVETVAWSPDGTRLASGGGDAAVTIWSRQSPAGKAR